MRSELWKMVLSSLPPGLTVERVAREFGKSPELTRRRMIESGYSFHRPKPKIYRLPQWAANADWSLPNIDIARKYGKTRERVRQMRQKIGKPKVESRGRTKPNHSRNGANL